MATEEAGSGISAAQLVLSMSPDTCREFYPLFQRGMLVPVKIGCTLSELLGSQFGLSEAYVAERITTIFLDSKPVDDMNTAIVRANSTIALSGAMPGLVGATMRRGGYYAAFRSGISHQKEQGTSGMEHCLSPVRIKLFNLLLPELGPGFLERGVLLTGSELTAILKGMSADSWRGCSEIYFNGTLIQPALLQGGSPFSADATVSLSINFKEPS